MSRPQTSTILPMEESDMPKLSKVWSLTAPTQVPLAVFPTYNDDKTPAIGADGYQIFTTHIISNDVHGHPFARRALGVQGTSKSHWWKGSQPAWRVSIETTKTADDAFFSTESAGKAKSEPSFSTNVKAFAFVVGVRSMGDVERIVRDLMKGKMKSKHTLDEPTKVELRGRQWLSIGSKIQTSRELGELVRQFEEEKSRMTEHSESRTRREVEDSDEEEEELGVEVEEDDNGQGPSVERRVTFQ